jgi:hypothetical protein
MDTELETGTYVRSAPRRRHNGYWAGDFSEAPPMPWEQLRRVMEAGRPVAVRGGW